MEQVLTNIVNHNDIFVKSYYFATKKMFPQLFVFLLLLLLMVMMMMMMMMMMIWLIL